VPMEPVDPTIEMGLGPSHELRVSHTIPKVFAMAIDFSQRMDRTKRENRNQE